MFRTRCGPKNALQPVIEHSRQPSHQEKPDPIFGVGDGQPHVDGRKDNSLPHSGPSLRWWLVCCCSSEPPQRRVGSSLPKKASMRGIWRMHTWRLARGGKGVFSLSSWVGAYLLGRLLEEIPLWWAEVAQLSSSKHIHIHYYTLFASVCWFHLTSRIIHQAHGAIDFSPSGSRCIGRWTSSCGPRSMWRTRPWTTSSAQSCVLRASWGPRFSWRGSFSWCSSLWMPGSAISRRWEGWEMVATPCQQQSGGGPKTLRYPQIIHFPYSLGMFGVLMGTP